MKNILYALCLLLGTTGCTVNYTVELIQANADGSETSDTVDDNDTTAASTDAAADFKIPTI